MKAKFSTSLFTAWAVLFMMVFIVDTSAAWYEWTKEGRDKLEWRAEEVKCSVLVQFKGGVRVDAGIGSDNVSGGAEAEIEYVLEEGSRTLCLDGTTHRDCREILGFWESWDREGDCVPEGRSVD